MLSEQLWQEPVQLIVPGVTMVTMRRLKGMLLAVGLRKRLVRPGFQFRTKTAKI